MSVSNWPFFYFTTVTYNHCRLRLYDLRQSFTLCRSMQWNRDHKPLISIWLRLVLPSRISPCSCTFESAVHIRLHVPSSTATVTNPHTRVVLDQMNNCAFVIVCLSKVIGDSCTVHNVCIAAELT